MSYWGKKSGFPEWLRSLGILDIELFQGKIAKTTRL
jgi:hypothetical protein